MLAGLLFATHDADDHADRLAATLPFGGVTLIEYQARLLIGAGVTQLIVVVARLTPELLGAINRIGRRGVTVDAVRSAGEAVEKLHPLARILMLADGLITTEAVVASLATDGGDALLVMPEKDAVTGFERVGGQMAWAGVARLDPRRVGEVAALPRDYDLQSSLLRLAAQAGAVQVLLSAEALRGGHGIERHAKSLEVRGRAVLASIVSGGRSWFDRFVLAPIAKFALPRLVERNVAGAAMGGSGIALGAVGLALLEYGWAGTGLMLAVLGTIALALGATLSGLRDEDALVRAQGWGISILSALMVLALGLRIDGAKAETTALTLAIGLVINAGLGERAITERMRDTWWGSPPAYLLVAALGTLAGAPFVALVAGVLYATATLAAVIERLRPDA